MVLIASSFFLVLRWELSGLKTDFFAETYLQKGMIKLGFYCNNVFRMFFNLQFCQWRLEYNSSRKYFSLKNDFFCVPERPASVWERGFCFLPPLAAEKLS